MSEIDFEGTEILEKLAELGRVEEFYLAVDTDDLEKVKRMLREAGIDRQTIAIVLEKIEHGTH